MPPMKRTKPSLMALPTELRLDIYSKALDLDPKQYPFEWLCDSPDKKATTPFLLKAQIQVLASLAGTCKKIRLEFLSEFFCHSQIYLRHESFKPRRDCGCYTEQYQRGLDIMVRDPLLGTYTTNVYWALMLHEDKIAVDSRFFRGIHHYVPDILEVGKSREWPLDTYDFVMALPNLTTLHVEVDFTKDWLDWKKSNAGCLFELWMRDTMKKKLTLRLTFMGADRVVRKAFKSGFVRRGRPESRLTKGNMLKHLLMLPENHYKDVPSGVIQRHFGYMNPRWPRLERF